MRCHVVSAVIRRRVVMRCWLVGTVFGLSGSGGRVPSYCKARATSVPVEVANIDISWES